MPFTTLLATNSAPSVITNEHNNPSGLYSSENISNLNSVLESQRAASGPETDGRVSEHAQPPSGLVMNKDTDIYKVRRVTGN